MIKDWVAIKKETFKKDTNASQYNESAEKFDVQTFIE